MISVFVIEYARCCQQQTFTSQWCFAKAQGTNSLLNAVLFGHAHSFDSVDAKSGVIAHGRLLFGAGAFGHHFMLSLAALATTTALKSALTVVDLITLIDRGCSTCYGA